VRRALQLGPRDKVWFGLEGEAARIRRAPLRVLAGFGAVRPRQRPEDLERLREEFEMGVAEEVTAETW